MGCGVDCGRMWCQKSMDLAQNFTGIWFMYDIVVLEPLVQWWFYMVSPQSSWMLHKNLPSTSRTARDLGFVATDCLSWGVPPPGMHYQFLVPSRVSSAPWWPLLLCLRPKKKFSWTVMHSGPQTSSWRKQSIGIWGVEQNFTPSKSIGHKVWFLPKTKYN